MGLFNRFITGTYKFRKFLLQGTELIPTLLQAGISGIKIVSHDASSKLHPRKLTWIPKMAIFKRDHLLQTIILGIHVSFRGCIWNCVKS